MLFAVSDTALAVCSNPSDYTEWSGGYHYDWDRQGLTGCLVNPATGMGKCTSKYEVTVSYWSGNRGMVPINHYNTTKSCVYYAK